MADITINKQISCLQVACTTSSGSVPIDLGGVKKVIVKALTNDVYIDFDQPVATTTSYRLSAANTADTAIELEMGLITKMYAQAQTGTATLYIISIVG